MQNLIYLRSSNTIVLKRTIQHNHVEAFSKNKSLEPGDPDSVGLECGLGTDH